MKAIVFSIKKRINFSRCSLKLDQKSSKLPNFFLGFKHFNQNNAKVPSLLKHVSYKPECYFTSANGELRGQND